MKIVDIKGKRFGRLTVIDRNGFVKNGGARLKAWVCKCDCGNTKTLSASRLISGNTKSCGCYANDRRSESHRTHGMSGTKLYVLWSDIKKRATNKGTARTRRFYKGVSICKDWLGFEKFYEWAKDSYSPGLDIDRINTLEGYSPSNCRFITRKENSHNTKRSKIWHIRGITFNSSGDAAKYFRCAQSHIYFLCHGRNTKTKYYPPEKGCYAEYRYPNNH